MLFFVLNIDYQFFLYQEIQKIVVFEGVFEKIFSIIREEGYSDGGVVVQVIVWDHHDLLLDFFIDVTYLQLD
jgi:hypothetical protein